jgi:glycosyltransferase involved in cell wall biosynthesis
MATQVLYISYDGMTDSLGQSQVIPYLKGLSKKGYQFTIISCEKKENFEQNKEKIKSVLAADNIEWHPISYTKQPPVLSTIYDVFRIKKLAFSLHQKNNFSIVHCRSYISSLIGLQLKKKFGVKFIFDMRGLWADERVDGKLWNLKNPVFNSVYRFFKKKELDFLQNADYTISLTFNAADEILSWKQFKTIPPKIMVIPCCADLELFNKSNLDIKQLQTLQYELNIEKEDFILLYLGSIGTWYMLDEMMEFFSILKQKKSQAKFLFVTKDEHERILQCAEKYGVNDSVIIRAGNREEIPYLISVSDFSVFFILPSYSKKASSPTKQGEIMAMGIPVVCNTNVGDTDKIITDYNSGVLVKEFNTASYAAAVERMQQPYSEQEIIHGANEYFSLANGIDRYAAVYLAVMS